MRFKFQNQEYRIWFKYEADRNGKRETCCFIDEEDAPGTTFAAGSAICAPSDRFCKETGRKVALAKAMPHWKNNIPVIPESSMTIYNLCGADWDRIKQFRTAAWQCYFKRAEQPTREKSTNAG